MQPSTVIDFWFRQHGPSHWWQKDDGFDRLIKARFESAYWAAVAGELWSWRTTAQGRLAEIIVIDQFARNMFRHQPQAFAHDPLALALSQEAVAAGALADLQQQQKAFLLMPYRHSESLLIHDQALQLFGQPGLEQHVDFEKRHRDIIARFGRYPHRNAILDRHSTPAEVEFLAQPDSGF